MVSKASPDQTLIEVSGPKSAVEQISYAGIEIDVSGASADLSANVETVLYDSEGALLELPSVTKNVSYVHMSVEVLAVKEVPIELNVMGTPAEGYLATGVVESDPATVKIAGTTSTLSSVSKISIPEEELNITGESSDMVNIINIKEYLPTGVKLSDSTFNGRITATVYIEPEYKRTLEIAQNNISIKNIPDGLEAVLPEEETTYELKVSGLEAAVTAIQQNAVKGTVDVAAYMEENDLTDIKGKTYTLPVTFDLGDEIEIESEVDLKITFKEADGQ